MGEKSLGKIGVDGVLVFVPPCQVCANFGHMLPPDTNACVVFAQMRLAQRKLASSLVVDEGSYAIEQTANV